MATIHDKAAKVCMSSVVRAMIAAIILAAGHSERMGTFKLLLPYGHSTILETVVKTATLSLADAIIVVVNQQMPKDVAERLGQMGACIVVNEMQHSEMIDSLRKALIKLRCCADNIEAFIVMLADQPAIKRDVIDAIITAHRKTGAGIVIPTFKGKRGHPVLLSMQYADELISYHGEQGLRSFILEHKNDVFELPVETDAILRDIDTHEDYEREVRNLTLRPD